jgi:outer membrane protein assembly factor BamB
MRTACDSGSARGKDRPARVRAAACSALGVTLLLALTFSPSDLFTFASAAAPSPQNQPAATNQTVSPADQWPHFRGSRLLTGVTAATLPEKLSVAWTYEAGASIESSAAIVDGSVYVGSHAEELVALELATGKLRWKYQTKGPIGESSPAVAGGTVYIGDLSGFVHAVEAASGRALWTFKTDSEIKASPMVLDGKILIGSYDEHLYALHAATGALLWKVQAQGPVHSTAGVLDGVAYVSGCDGQLRGVRIRDGQQVLQFDAGAYTGASPALEQNGARRSAYFGTFENDVQAVDLAAQRRLWRYQHPERKFPFYSSAALAEGMVVLGGRDKLVTALDARTGKALWTFATRARVDSSPAISGGRVYVGSGDGKLYVLDLKSGKKLSEFEAGAPLSASPAVASGYLVIGSQDGVLYALK